MPLYEISHSTPLSSSQEESLAKEITRIHSTKFGTPSLFVNVQFRHVDSSGSAGGEVLYVGGKRRQTNTIIAHIRTGPSRTQSDYDTLTLELTQAWDKIIKPSYHSQHLSRVFIMGAILAGRESGFVIPKAGEDGAWIKENMAEFERRADKGESDFVELVEEIEARGLGR